MYSVNSLLKSSSPAFTSFPTVPVIVVFVSCDSFKLITPSSAITFDLRIIRWKLPQLVISIESGIYTQASV